MNGISRSTGILRKPIAAMTVVVAVLGSALGVFADDAPDLVQLMTDADAAARRVRTVSYDLEYFATGELASRVPHVNATVIGRQGRVGFFAELANRESSPAPNSFRFTGSYKAGEGITKSFDLGTDGVNVFSVENESKQFVVGRLDKASALIDSFRPLFMLEFFHATPFHDEITATERRYEGVVDIDGIQCDVVYVKYQREGLDARWYIARKDSLPRRVDRLIFRDGEKIGERVLIVKNLNTQPSIRPDEFMPATPEGFERRAFSQPPAREPLRKGTRAPDFDLRTPDGKVIRLSSLRGNVVVLDFWATWCVPCKISMPQMQSLHEKYADRPVKIIGLSCWEKGDPAKMMQAGGLTYDLLLDADEVAKEYGVDSIPTVFVLDGDGIIRFRHSGFVPTLERKLDRAIRRSLPKGDGE